MIPVLDIYEIPGKLNNKLKKKFKYSILSTWFKGIEYLPLTWEDSVTKPSNIDKCILREMADGLVEFNLPAVESVVSKEQKCFHISLLEKERNPAYRLMVGYATINEEVVAGNDWHCHAFIITPDNTIIEPTPIKRDRYFGIEISDGLIDRIKNILGKEYENLL